MDETPAQEIKRPGIVLFVAVLNFIGAFFAVCWLLLCAAALFFGSALGVYQAVMDRVSHAMPAVSTANFNAGISLLFGFFLVLFSLIAVLAVGVGVSLLKGKKFAWYLQVAFSVLGLFGFPIGTILNAVILIFFFQSPVRGYFKV